MDQFNLVPFLALVLFERFDALHEICGILVQVLADGHSLSSRKAVRPTAEPRKRTLVE